MYVQVAQTSPITARTLVKRDGAPRGLWSPDEKYVLPRLYGEIQVNETSTSVSENPQSSGGQGVEFGFPDRLEKVETVRSNRGKHNA
jgi:hypothetical protein